MKLHLYLTSSVLLLTLSWRTSSGLPLPDPGANGAQDANSAQCASLFKTLLLNLTALLETEDLCNSLTTSNEVTVPSVETVQSCTPTSAQNSGCVMQTRSSFSESECRRSIMRDLAYYDAAVRSYLQSQLHTPEKEEPLLRPVLGIIQSLKDCSSTDGENETSEEVTNMWKDSTFTNRQNMCKMMRGFHVRTITINRAMGYISSGDHRK